MLFSCFVLVFQDVAWLAMKRLADPVERREADRRDLARFDVGEVDVGNPDFLRQLVERHFPIGHHPVKS